MTNKLEAAARQALHLMEQLGVDHVGLREALTEQGSIDLTDDEILAVTLGCTNSISIARAVIAAYKEKNK